MPEALVFGTVVIFSGVACLGFGAAISSVWWLTLDPSRWQAWAEVLIGVSVGGYVGAYSAGCVVREILWTLFPARLRGDDSGLHLTAWNTAQGLWAGFRRASVAFPLGEIVGVGLRIGQGGQSQLFLGHFSGPTLSTGWAGNRDDAVAHGRALADWLASMRKKPVS